MVFRQITGKSLELRTAPFFVNFSFLCFNEREWLLNIQKFELINERKFCKTFLLILDEDI